VRRDLTFERVYPHPPERVWRALTEPQALGEWLMPSTFQPKVGHVFQFRTDPASGFDGVIHCQVLEVDAPHRLVYSWLGGWAPQPTFVTWTLEPVAEGTKLRLDHTGFEGVRGIALSFILGSGWKSKILQKLADTLNTMQHAESLKGTNA
jgi:uncharacterized protein YndB with AHSA1/START domain